MYLILALLGLTAAFAWSGTATPAAKPDPNPEPDPDLEGVDGTEGDDSIAGGEEDELIRGLGGDDTLSGGAGDDWIEGGAGDDLIDTGEGDDYASGGEGNDSLDSWAGNDTLHGNGGDDTIRAASPDTTYADGGDGDDHLVWVDGEATLRGGAGDDLFTFDREYPAVLQDGLLDGGEGEDTLSLDGLYPNGLTVTLDRDGSGVLSDGTTEVGLSGFEVYELQLGNERQFFDGSASEVGVTVIGHVEDGRFGMGYSTITTGSGDDHLIDGTEMDAGAGDDILERTYGGGVMTGGAGADTFVITSDIGGYDDGGPPVSDSSRITDYTPGEDRLSLTVTYDEEYYDGPNDVIVTMDPPEVSLEEDLEAGVTRIMIDTYVAVVLEGVTGLQLSDLDIEIRAS